MKDNTKRLALKILHTVIWVFYTGVVAYMFYLDIIDRIDYTFWIGVGLVLIEGLVVFFYKWKCPLTEFQRKYVENPEEGFDIFLPKWIARNNIGIFSVLLVLSLIFAIYRLLT